MYCGRKIEVEEAATPPAAPLVAEPVITPPVVERVFFENTSKESAPVSQPTSVKAVEVEKPKELEEQELVQASSNIFQWQTKLVSMLLNKEITHEVFKELYTEYRKRLRDLNQIRRLKLKELEQQMRMLSLELDQLKLKQDKEGINQRLYSELEQKLASMKQKFKLLSNPFNVTLADIPELEKSLIKTFERTSQAISTIGVETALLIISDLAEIFEDLKYLVDQHKHVERKLKELELRWKVGEISKEDYERKKEVLDRELS